MKRFACAFLILILLVSFSTLAFFSPKTPKHEGDGFRSVDALIQQYIKYLNDADFNGMLSCFAIETYVDNLNTQAYLEELQALLPTTALQYPVSSEYTRQMLIATRYSDLSSRFMRQYLYDTYSGTPYTKVINSAIHLEDVSDYIQTGADRPMNDWKGKIKFIDYADADKLTDGAISKKDIPGLRVKRAAKFGCSEYVDKPCYISIDGKTYVLTFGYGNYGGKWYIVDAGIVCSFLDTTMSIRFGGYIPLSMDDTQ